MAETTTTTVQAPRDESTEVTQPPSRRKGIIIAVVAVLVLAGLGFYWHSTYYEDTDDAQINGHLIQISSRIAGQVAKVEVDENQQVKAGQVIASLIRGTTRLPLKMRRPPWPARRRPQLAAQCKRPDYDDQHWQQPEFSRSGCKCRDGVDFAGSVTGGSRARPGDPGGGQCFEGAARPGSL